GGIDAGIIGETRRDPHDLAVAAVDQETSVHLIFLGILRGASGDRERGCGRNQQKRGDKAPAKTVAVWRAEESALNIGQTLLHFSAKPLRPRCQYQCRERANSKKSLFLSVHSRIKRQI